MAVLWLRSLETEDGSGSLARMDFATVRCLRRISRCVCSWGVDIFFEDVFGRDEWPLLDVFVLKR